MHKRILKYTCIGGILVSQSVFAATTVLEDFSGSINLSKFNEIERSIELVNEKLIMSAKSSSYSKQGKSNSLLLDDNSITMLQAELSVTELILGNAETQQAVLRVAGEFYNANSPSATTYLGDVFTIVALGDRGNGPEAWYEIQVSTSDDFSTTNMTQGSLGTIELHNSYTVSITYDGGQGFSFGFNGAAVNVAGPARLGEAYEQVKLVGTRVRFGQNNSTLDSLNDESPDNGSSATIVGTIDNVTTNNGLVDSFSGSSIDQTIWDKKEFSKIIENGKLKLIAKSTTSDRARTSFNISNQDVNFLGAKVTLSSDSTQAIGGQNRARIYSYWYNDTYDVNDSGNGLEGNIWARSTIRRKADGSVVCLIGAERVEDAVHNTYTDIVPYEEYETCDLDTQYDLSIEKTDTSLVFKKDGVIIKTHIITTPMYPAKQDTSKTLRAETRDAAGETVAFFDDITTDYLPPALTLVAKNARVFRILCQVSGLNIEHVI